MAGAWALRRCSTVAALARAMAGGANAPQLQMMLLKHDAGSNCGNATRFREGNLRSQIRFLCSDHRLAQFELETWRRWRDPSSGQAMAPWNRRMSTNVPPQVPPMPTDSQLGLHTGNKRLQGRYLLGKQLGKGSYGIVWAGKDLDAMTRQVVAIKMLKKKYFQGGPKRMERFKKEIAALRRFRHPHITRLLDLMHDVDNVYLVMEFVPGGDLMSRMEDVNHSYGEVQARKLFQQIIDAVDYCHSRGVIHRDIKPHNVLMALNGDAKVCDFGLSELRGDDLGNPDGLMHAEAGTLAFMAPECFTHSTIGYAGAPTDVWSLGCTLYTMVTMTYPFMPGQWADQRTMIRLIVTGYYVVPRNISRGLARLLRRCLAVDVSKRITIPEIYQDPWFEVDYQPPDFTQYEEVKSSLQDVEAAFTQVSIAGSSTSSSSSGSTPRIKPRRLSAFDLLAPSFDVSTMITSPTDDYLREPKGDLARFTSLFPAKEILETTEEACKALGFNVQVMDFKMKITAPSPGREGLLCMTAEVAKVSKGAYMVEVRRVTGDHQEFHQFLRNVAAAIKDKIVKVPGAHD